MVKPAVVGIIQARMSSQRLPGKVLLPLVGSTSILEALCRRLSSSKVKWWIATTKAEADDPIAELGRGLGLSVFRGPEENVLLRFNQLLDLTNASWFVRVTADNPFTSGMLVNSLVEKVENISPDTNRIWAKHPESGYPLGFVPEVVRTSAIRRFARTPEIFNSHHATHVTSAIEQSASQSVHVGNKPSRPEWRWTVDTEADLRMARKAFRLLSNSWPVASYERLVSSLDAAPWVVGINQDEYQKAPRER